MNLSEFFQNNKKVAIAFSGGVDSAYLVYAAKQNQADFTAYYVKTAFQPEFELADANRLAQELQIEMKILEMDVLAFSQVTENPKNRCYFCKRAIFGKILEAAKKDGYAVVLDGTNASDDEGDRPGMVALRELSVLSPLREAGLTKDDIRKLSKEANLFTFDKPAYACLATRIKTGECITAEKLSKVEQSEQFLHDLGFVDFRVRMVGDTAKIQAKEKDLELLLINRGIILTELKKYFENVTLDLEIRE